MCEIYRDPVSDPELCVAFSIAAPFCGAPIKIPSDLLEDYQSSLISAWYIIQTKNNILRYSFIER